MSSAEPQPTDQIERRAFALLFTTIMLAAAGNTAMMSVLPAIGRHVGVPDVLVAAAFSLSALLWSLSAPYWAARAQRQGRKALIRIGIMGFGASMLLCGLVAYAGLTGLLAAIPMMIAFTLARCIYGWFGSASPPAAQAWVAVRTSDQTRTSALAILASAFGLGTVFGPAVAPFFILPVVGLAGPMFAFALVAVVMLWAIGRWLPSRARQQDGSAEAPARVRLSWRDGRVWPFIVYGFLIGTGQAATSQTLGFLVIDTLDIAPEAATAFIGVAMMAGAAATLLAQWGIIRLMRLTPPQLLRIGAALVAASCGLIAVSESYGTIVTAYALMCLGFGFARPGFTAGSSLAVERDEQDAVAGAITSVSGACFIVAPVAGVALYQWHAQAPFLLCGALALAMLVYALRSPVLSRSGHGEPPATDPDIV